jgi:hypothetical protein
LTSLSKQDLPEENEPIWVKKPTGYYGTPLTFEEVKKLLSRYGIVLAARDGYRTIYNGWLYGVKYFSETGQHKVWKVKLPEGDMADTLDQQPTLEQMDDSTNNTESVEEIKTQYTRKLNMMAAVASEAYESLNTVQGLIARIGRICQEEVENKK